MELHQMIYRRLRDDETLTSLTASYNGGAAVFYQRPAPAENARWESKIQYPRIDYTLDLMENPARNTSGVLTVNVWCDTQVGPEPEDIEGVLRSLLHAAFTQASDGVYCFAWVRSDAFEAKDEHGVRTTGVTVLFDVMACPCQWALYPDPMKGLGAWARTVLPGAVIVGEDPIDGWFVPQGEQIALYWRMTSQRQDKKLAYATWLTVTVEGHVYAQTAQDRLRALTRLHQAAALANHVTLEDASPLFLDKFDVKPHLNYITQGQIQAQGRFAILQPQWANPPQLPPMNPVFNTADAL